MTKLCIFHEYPVPFKALKIEIEGEFEKEFKKDIIAAMKDVRREIKESYVSIAYIVRGNHFFNLQ